MHLVCQLVHLTVAVVAVPQVVVHLVDSVEVDSAAAVVDLVEQQQEVGVERSTLTPWHLDNPDKKYSSYYDINNEGIDALYCNLNSLCLSVIHTFFVKINLFSLNTVVYE